MRIIIIIIILIINHHHQSFIHGFALEKIHEHSPEQSGYITKFLSANTIETFHPRSAAEEVSLHLSSITSYMESLAQELGIEHEQVLNDAVGEREKEARREATTKFGSATQESIMKVLEDTPPVAPKLTWLSKSDILAYAGEPDITASLMTIPGQLARTTHPLARVAQAIMSRVGLHFTSAGHTTRLVDTQQQPNLQAVSGKIIIITYI